MRARGKGREARGSPEKKVPLRAPPLFSKTLAQFARMMYLCSGERDGMRYAQKSNKSITKSSKMTFDAESKCAEMRSKFFQEIRADT